MSTIFYTILLLTCCLILVPTVYHTSTWTLNTEHDQLSYTLGANISCLFQATVTLISCQCRLHFDDEPLVDLSQGHNSTVVTRDKYNMSYHGTGLEHGQCGVDLSGVAVGTRLLVCRARAQRGGWRYSEVTLVLNAFTSFKMTVQPRHVVVHPGGRASVLCTMDQPIKQCRIFLTREGRWIELKDSTTRNGRYSYHGKGLRHGQCGITIDNATETDSGPMRCCLVTKEGRDSIGSSTLHVRAFPTNITLALSTGTVYGPGETLRARCTVHGSHPRANITWLLGDLVIRQDQEDDVPDPAWRWPWERQSTTQMLSHVVKTEDHAKELVCRAEHSAFERHLEERRKITLEAAHCFWNNNQIDDWTQYKIGVGKIELDWSLIEEGEQKVDIEEVIVKPQFKVFHVNLIYDIAIVRLASPVTLSATVNVACVDWERREPPLREGTTGIATGWGMMVNGTAMSDDLQWVNLPLVSYDTCWSLISQDLQMYLTYDKVCAGHVNRTISVCPGDSGGGLVFEHSKSQRYYLHGIVSASFAPETHEPLSDGCFSNFYTGFTDVDIYVDWISQHIKPKTKDIPQDMSRIVIK